MGQDGRLPVPLCHESHSDRGPQPARDSSSASSSIITLNHAGDSHQVKSLFKHTGVSILKSAMSLQQPKPSPTKKGGPKALS